MEYPRQIRNNCTRIFTEQFKISSFIERDTFYVIYIQFMKRDCLSSWKLSDYLCWNSKETLKHLMIFVVSEFKSQITIEIKKKQMNEEKMIKTFVGVG